MKGVIHFGKREKLHPLYVGPFDNLEKVSLVTYGPLLQRFTTYLMFYIYKIHLWPFHILDYQSLQIKKDLSYENVHVQIVDRKEQIL